MFIKTIISYSVLLTASINGRKSFEELGAFINKSGKTISRMVRPKEELYEYLQKLALKEFENKKILYLTIDDTKIRKIYAEFMEGTSDCYDSLFGKKINAYKLLMAMISDGKTALPWNSMLLFSKELVPDITLKKSEWIKELISNIQKMFPHAKIYVLADGAFATREFLQWCVDNKIKAEVRMKSSSVVTINGEKKKVKLIDYLTPVGKQEARTIDVLWHDIPLQLTAVKRKDKNGNVTIVYQAATFKARPIQHLKIYKKRWQIEKFFRTTKQKFGLEQCYSTKIETQEAHFASCMLAYTLVARDQKKRRLPTPEAALKAAKLKNAKNLIRYSDRLHRLFSHVYV